MEDERRVRSAAQTISIRWWCAGNAARHSLPHPVTHRARSRAALLHKPQVESQGVGDPAGSPGTSGIGSAKVSAVRSTGPGNFVRDGADSAQSLGGVGELDTLGQGGGGKEEEQ